MDRSVSVRTPESIAFSYELAGLGSRFLALVLDMTLQVLILSAIFWGFALIGSYGGKTPVKSSISASTLESVVIAVIVTIVFLVFFGYFIAFEAFWNGQTPGKKVLGIRVVRDGGYPLDLAGSLIRNLVRVGEFALGLYAISAAATLISPENKRLGDMAAGTIVVRDARSHSLAAIRERADAEQPRAAMITDEEHALIARFMARRDAMSAHSRHNLASQIADRVRPRISRDLQYLDDEALLERLNAVS
ncbi:MAG TPA: RDD family protein [Candidatus Baltobacteraceae bacterium]|nr:RDD family protein [Candidatus Baltobacteraceae bacterium]